MVAPVIVAEIPAHQPPQPFLPLNRPMIEKRPRSRAINFGHIDEPSNHRFSPSQLKKLLYHLPPSIIKRQSNIFNDLISTTTTPPPLSILNPSSFPVNYVSKPKFQRRIPTAFHWSGFERESKMNNKEESGIVFMVGLFNLLAVVVYAAYRHVSGEPTLSDRVITWQVQKVLDELVLRVHSSDYASELLSRSMPEGVATDPRYLDKNPLKWLKMGITAALQDNNQNGLQNWLENLKDQLMTEVAGSQAARRSVRLNPIIYGPMRKLYAAITKKQPLESSRAMISPWINEVGAAVVAFGELPIDQIEDILNMLSHMDNIEATDQQLLPLLETVLNNAVFNKHGLNSRGKRSVGTNNRHNSIAAALASSFTHAYAQTHDNTNIIRNRKTRPMNLPVGYSGWSNDRRINSKYRNSHLKPQHRMVDFDAGHSQSYPIRGQRLSAMETNSLSSSKLHHRVGNVAVPENQHWTDGWFSLVTSLAPVGLDTTILYSKAKANPKCLKSLLCHTNNAWKRVGAVQAAVTPFLSVLISWSLEDISPHSLGDSLIAIRAGWMGKDCSSLYPNCYPQQSPNPEAHQAAEFLEKLQLHTRQPSSSVYISEEPKFKVTTEIYDQNNYIDRNDHDSYIPKAPREQPIERENHITIDKKEAVNTFEDRFGGQGPMSVEGNHVYLDKFHRSGNGQDKQIVPIQTTVVPYTKYDSPIRDERQEEIISGSNTVAGMVLQDKHSGKPLSPKTPKQWMGTNKPLTRTEQSQSSWNHLYNLGMYGGSVQQAEQKYSVSK